MIVHVCSRVAYVRYAQGRPGGRRPHPHLPRPQRALMSARALAEASVRLPEVLDVVVPLDDRLLHDVDLRRELWQIKNEVSSRSAWTSVSLTTVRTGVVGRWPPRVLNRGPVLPELRLTETDLPRSLRQRALFDVKRALVWTVARGG